MRERSIQPPFSGRAPGARAETSTHRWLPAFLILLLGLSMALGTGCGGAGSQQGEESTAVQTEEPSSGDEENGEEGGRPERATSVTAAPVQRGPLVEPVVAEGTIRARHITDLLFEVGGRIERVHVSEGDRVRKGQKLATLDAREYLVALEEATSRYIQALGQIAVEDEQLSGQRTQDEITAQMDELNRLEAAGAITRQERLEREMQLGVSAVKDGAYRRELLEGRTGLAAARADEARAQLNLERTVLRAPFDGVVSSLVMSQGQRVQTGQVLCRVVDDVDIEAVVGVLESDLGAMQLGRPALLMIPALGDTLRARVDVISPDIDAASRTCQVLMRLRSEDGRVKPGMFVRAAVAGTIHPDLLLVPREAILTRDSRPLLFKVEDDRARWVYVELGVRNDQLVEIRKVLQGGPLDPGTLVVVDNHLTLTHDAKVNVKSTIVPSDPWSRMGLEAGTEVVGTPRGR